MPYVTKAIEELQQYLSSANPSSIVLTTGCFDLLHIGHLRTLQQAKAWGDILIVILLTDELVKGEKGPERPIFPFEQRKELLLALRCVDYVLRPSSLNDPWGEFEGICQTCLDATRNVSYWKGGDYTDLGTHRDFVIAWRLGIQVMIGQLIEGVSTQQIISNICNHICNKVH